MTLQQLIEQYTYDAIELRRKIHRNPEVALEEYETTQLVKSQLKAYGIEVQEEIPLATGAVGVLKGTHAGNTLLLRADIDALPIVEKSGLDFASENHGKCHACGHDIHTSALLLAARVLAQLKEQLHGQIVFLFQPAEETGQGALKVIEAGVFEKYKPDLVIGAHCWPEVPGGAVGFRKDAFMASSDIFHIKVTGQGGHGAHPHRSIDPIVISAYVLTELQTIVSRRIAPLDSAVVTVGKITGGTAANSIPENVAMEGTIRTTTNEIRQRVKDLLEEITCGTAKAMGGKGEVAFKEGMPALVNDNEAVDLLLTVAEEQLGQDKIVMLPKPSMGSEDFARYLELCPGAMFRIGTGDPEDAATKLPLHNPGIHFSEKGIAAGATLMAATALRYLA